MDRIRPIAICVFRNGDKILIRKDYDPAAGSWFCRPLGGGIEFGETSRQTILREIQEEIGAQVVNLRLLGTLENMFTYLGKPAHEIIQVYDGKFTDCSLYERASIAGTESDDQAFTAEWRSIDSFDESVRLVPEGLHALLECSL